VPARVPVQVVPALVQAVVVSNIKILFT
jgi:hypothetical protein